jgi:hypothetical protein
MNTETIRKAQAYIARINRLTRPEGRGCSVVQLARRKAALELVEQNMPERHPLLAKVSDDELRAYRANAYTTGCLCGGHNKAYRNECAVEEYDRELLARGLPPVRNGTKGAFNGPGAH